MFALFARPGVLTAGRKCQKAYQYQRDRSIMQHLKPPKVSDRTCHIRTNTFVRHWPPTIRDRVRVTSSSRLASCVLRSCNMSRRLLVSTATLQGTAEPCSHGRLRRSQVLALLQSNIAMGSANGHFVISITSPSAPPRYPNTNIYTAQERRSMSSPPWNTAAYWRELAAQTRKLADEVKDAPTKAMILAAAGEYD